LTTIISGVTDAWQECGIVWQKFWVEGGAVVAAKMKAAVFVEAGRIALNEKPIPDIGPLAGC
jgi:hypothetical protein